MGGVSLAGPTGHSARGVPLLVEHAVSLSGASSPKISVLNTAMGDDPGSFLRMYQVLNRMPARVSHLELFPMPNVSDPADLLLSADVIFVGGGSVANMVAVWRVHGIDQIMRSAWEAGVVLAGVSAGAICWFGSGTTDSFGLELQPFSAGLGLLAGSYSPHYDSEPARRPLFQSLVADGTLPAGIACDDGAAAHYTDDTLAEIVADRAGARGYRVEWTDGGVSETVLPTRLLSG
jgi:peptidase E